MNGKRPNKKMSHLKIIQMNKGNSNFHSFANIICHNTMNNKANIAIIGEANLEFSDQMIATDYPEFNIKFKAMNGANESKLVDLICKGIQYKRKYQNEFDDMSMVWLRVSLA